MVTLESTREEIIAAWLERLRDPASKQAHGSLREGDGFCCLGHLCDVLGLAWTPSRHGRYQCLGEDTTLPASVQKAAGLRTEGGRYGTGASALWEQNDSGSTLGAIADIIEQRPHGLFVEVSP